MTRERQQFINVQVFSTHEDAAKIVEQIIKGWHGMAIYTQRREQYGDFETTGLAVHRDILNDLNSQEFVVAAQPWVVSRCC